MAIRDLLNNAKFFQFANTVQISQVSGGIGAVQKARCLIRPTHVRQDILFLRQDRRTIGARNVHGVREYDKGSTCLREAAPAKTGNDAGGPCAFARACFFNNPIRS